MIQKSIYQVIMNGEGGWVDNQMDRKMDSPIP